MSTLKELRDAVKSWAMQEKQDIDSGKKKTPVSSLEKFMADTKKTDLHPDVQATLAAIKAAKKADIDNLAPSKYLRPNPPAAAQSRMDANKPVKTALVREVEPGRSRLAEAAKRRERYPNGVRVMSPGLTKAESEGALPPHPDSPRTIGSRGGWDRDALKKARMQSAAETGEARQFVGVMKGETVPGAHKAQGARMQAIVESIREGRSESVREARRAAIQEKKLNSLTQAPAHPNKPTPGQKAGGQRFTPRLTGPPPGTPGSEFTAQTKSDIDRPHKDLGKIAVNLIRNAGEPGSSVDEAGGRILRQALAQRLGYNAGPPARFSVAGAMSGKLGIYGAIKGALEGSKTLRKLKTGAYDLTPTGEPVLKKGLIES